MGATGRESGASEQWMKRCTCVLMLLACGVRAETVLLTHDAHGKLLKQAPAVLRIGGRALVPREAFFGAAAGTLLDERGRMHPVLWITGEDADAGVVEVYVGAQAPKGPDVSSGWTKHVKMVDHEADSRVMKEAGGFGAISRLNCGGAKDSGSGPLFDEHGLLAGWHATKVVDGQVLAFGMPLSRFEEMSRRHLSVAEWNARHDAAQESSYQTGIGHLWADDFDGALYYFSRATQAEPGNARAWYHLGFAEGKNGHGKAKIASYRKAVELDPKFAPAHYYLGFSLLLSGDRDGAVEEYEKLRDMDSPWAVRLRLFLDAAHVDVLEKKGKGTARAQRVI